MSSDTPRFQIVTVATQPEDPCGPGHLRVLEESARRCGLDLTVLGHGRRWTGSSMRLLLYADLLETAPDDALYVFVDAYDVVLLPAVRELEARFRTFGAPIVFSAETNCWPFPELAEVYPEAPFVRPVARSPERSLRLPPPLRTPFRFLNAGSFVGRAGAVRSLIRALAPRGTESDQGLVTRHFLEHRGDLKLDYGAALFQTLHGVAPGDLAFREGQPWTLGHRWLGTEPCLLHGNGAGRAAFFDLLSRLRARGWP